MTPWPEVVLGNLLQVKHGFAFKGEHFQPEGDQLVLTPGNFKIGGGLQQRSGKERFYSGSYPEEFRLEPGDLLIAMTDLTQNSPILGSPLVVPSDGVFLHNQRLGKVEIVDNRLLDRGFAYFLFVSDLVRSQLRGSATGSTVRHTAPGRIYSAKVNLPPVATQRKIAAILFAYDDLIENNNRRISILEEMAQRIYSEWFVDFRYPGYENVPLVDSEFGPVPEGWAMVGLSRIVECVRDAVASGPDSVDVPYVPIDCIDPKSLCLREWLPGENAKSSLIRFARDDILFGAMRPYFHKVAIAPFAGTTRSTCFVLRARELSLWAFAVMTIFDGRTVDYATRHSSGSTIPYARWGKTMENMPTLLPNHDMIESFARLLRPVLQVLTEAGAIQSNLRATRDFLLPRLVSGELDVTDLDIAMPEAAA